MMLDVLIGLLPVVVVSLVVFQWSALAQLAVCVVSCLVFEALFTWMRGKKPQLGDLSATVTGMLLGLSLPASAPIYIGVIGSGMAIGIGKVVFGGLGFNLFNPAMVGRAFVMLSFAAQMGAPAYVISVDPEKPANVPEVLTQATPLTVAKQAGKAEEAEADGTQTEAGVELGPLLLGSVNGSVGETSALALLIGGLYLCVRRTASWEIPAGMIAAVVVLAQLCYWGGLTPISGVAHLLGGSAMLGAFFIATDPVSSPITTRGKLLFGIGCGVLTVLIRIFSGYSEGVMFAVLLMNAMVPLINNWTVPVPMGGKVPAPAA